LLEAALALRHQPGFASAIRTSAQRVVELYESSRVLNWLMDDRARVLFGYFALHLHYGRDAADPSSGLTPTALKALCSEVNVCSPGRVVAMLSLMRFRGYFAPDGEVTDRRHRRLIATGKLVAFLRERWHPHFAAMAPLFPDGEALLAFVEDPASTKPLVDAMAKHFRAGFRFVIHAPEIRIFAERNAGMPILASLLVAGESGDSVPPTRPVPVSISALSRRFGVSRPHVLKLLRDAAEEGLIERTGRDGDHILMCPRLIEASQKFFATLYLFFAASAREARSA
jgi:hypothetical protein